MVTMVDPEGAGEPGALGPGRCEVWSSLGWRGRECGESLPTLLPWRRGQESEVSQARGGRGERRAMLTRTGIPAWPVPLAVTRQPYRHTHPHYHRPSDTTNYILKIHIVNV